jgi:nucleoid-associated protein YgaU
VAEESSSGMGGAGEDKGGSLFSSTKIKTEHVVAEGETLSGLALKYYGSAAKEKWMAIYDLNKRVIGDDPNLIKPGQRLRIPDLD